MSYKKILTILLSLAFTNTHGATCPPPELIKSAVFEKAELFDKKIYLWELVSAPFSYENKIWNVVFGLELPGASTESEALQRGQLKYRQSSIINPNPDPTPIPKHLICQYTPEGMPYWIEALSPPGD